LTLPFPRKKGGIYDRSSQARKERNTRMGTKMDFSLVASVVTVTIKMGSVEY
jgi:hypothetical protein